MLVLVGQPRQVRIRLFKCMFHCNHLLDVHCSLFAGYQGRLSYQSTGAAQPTIPVAPRGDQGFSSRPKSAGGGGIRRTSNLLQQQANSAATKSAMEEKIRLTQRQAILLFNQNNFEEALGYFEESLKLLQMIYPSNHPECIKAEKSILLTQRKMENR